MCTPPIRSNFSNYWGVNPLTFGVFKTTNRNRPKQNGIPVNEAILSKLQKILARADTSRGATQAEAEAAMAKAQKFAIEHDIDLASVSLDTGEIRIETDRVDLDGGTATRRPHHRFISQVLMACFDVRVLWHAIGSKWTSKATIIGEKTDVTIATYCWSYLNDVYPTLLRRYVAAHPAYGESALGRSSYYQGLTLGIIKVNRRQREEAKADPVSGTAYSLVLVKKEDTVTARVEQEFPNVKAARAPRQKSLNEYDQSAIAAGYRSGLGIKLGGALAAA